MVAAVAVAGVAVSAAGSAASGAAQSSANNKAGKAAAAGAANSTRAVQQGVGTARADMQPYTDVGGSANRELAYRMGLDQPKTPTPTSYALGQSGDPLWEQVLKGSELTPEWVNSMSNATGNQGWDVSPQTSEIYKGLSAKYQALKAEQGDTYKGQGEKGSLNDNYDMASYKKDPGYTPMTSLAFGEEQYKNDPGYTPMTSLDFGMDKYKNDPGYTPMTSLDFGMDKYKEDPGYTPMVNSLADLQATPGYQFQYDQGMQGVNNSAAAKGSLLSGRQLKDVNNYAQGQASTGFQAAWDRAQNSYQNAFNRNTSNYQNSQNAYNTAFNRNTSNWQNGQNAYNTAFNRNTSNFQQSQGAYQNAFNRDTTNRNNEFNRLQSMSNNGQQAAGSQAQYTMTGASDIAGVASNLGNTNAGLALAQGQNNANMITGITNSVNQGMGAYASGGGFGSGGGSSSGGATNAPNISNTQSLGNSNMWSQGSMFPNSSKNFGG